MKATRKRLYIASGFADLGELSPPWSGWAIRGGELISPEGYKIPVDWVRALPLTREALHGHQVQAQIDRQDRERARQIVRATDGMAGALAALESAWVAFRAAVPAMSAPPALSTPQTP